MANNSKILKLKGEIAKIKSDIAKEQAKISPLKKKIISAEESIRKTKSASTAKSKLNDINRAENAIATIEKKIGDILFVVISGIFFEACDSMIDSLNS